MWNSLLQRWLLIVACGATMVPTFAQTALVNQSLDEVTFHGGVLHAPPFATVVEQEDGTIEYGGFQIDLLQRLQIFAARDNVKLNIELSPAPPQYGPAFDLVASDCEEVSSTPEDCGKFDILVANFYATATRSVRADLSPSWQRSTISTIKLLEKTKGAPDVTTMAQAIQENATVCLKGGTFYSGVVREKFPEIDFLGCFSQDACLESLKNEECSLYASDELQLRSRAALDASLEVTPESFNTQYIVWALKDNTPNARLLKKWIYDANTNTTMDELYFKYFRKELCPVGTAGESCQLPCDPNHGRADERGRCICASTKWKGDDCSIEVEEDLNLIPVGVKRMVWSLFGVNCICIVSGALWLFWKRTSPQVRISQPFFLCLVLVGCLISSSALIPLSTEDGANGIPKCMATPWLYSVGFSITFGTLFAKIRRVYIIFKSAANMQRQKVTFSETIAITGLVLFFDMTILTVWTVVDPLEFVRTTLSEDKFGVPLESEGHCTSESWEPFTATLASLHLILLAFACYLCYVSRDIPTQFSEGKYVTIAMLSNLQIFVIAVPVLIILGADPETSFFVRSAVIWINDFMVIVLIFGNLIYQVHFVSIGSGSSASDKENMNRTISNAMNRYSTKQRERSERHDFHPSMEGRRSGTSTTIGRSSRVEAGSSRFDHDVLFDVKEENPSESESSRQEINVHPGGEAQDDTARTVTGSLSTSTKRTTWAGMEQEGSDSLKSIQSSSSLQAEKPDTEDTADCDLE